MKITSNREARKIFNETIKPLVVEQYGKNDIPALNEEWGIWLDNLCKDGVITERAYNNWTRTPG